MMTNTSNILINILSVFFIVGLTFGIIPNAFGQKKERTRLKVYYEKLPNADKKISLILAQGGGKNSRGVAEAEIGLTYYDQEEEVQLGTLKTDTLGQATLLIDSKFPLPKNEDGYHVIEAVYSGNDSLRSSNNTIEFLDVHFELSFAVVDSVKEVTVSAFQIDSTGTKFPIEELEFDIGVERLYSTLYLEEIETDENGVATMEFPDDIPGNADGNIRIVARIDDHDDYGTVKQSSEVGWGTRVDYSIKNNGRSLFGDEAPLWMIISVFVILAGAWFNFMLAVYKVFQIRDLNEK